MTFYALHFISAAKMWTVFVYSKTISKITRAQRMGGATVLKVGDNLASGASKKIF